MRGAAVCLLVSYHVLGGDPRSGMELDYPHFGRVVADLLVDVRMPLFAFIAGFVYALRPARTDTLKSFIAGKFRRLYIPGAISALLFFISAYYLSPGFSERIDRLWTVLFFPFMHYWFLQAILAIFLIYGTTDALMRHRFAPVVFVIGLGLYLFCPFIQPNLLSVNQAIYLFPFFMAGLIFSRYRQMIFQKRKWIMLIACGAALAGLVWSLYILFETGRVSTGRRDLQSLITGLSLCALMFLILPRVRVLEWLGPASFTIYLYHVFGSAGSRELLMLMGISNLGVLFTTGMIAGIGGPMLLDHLAAKNSVTQRWLLGRRT